MGLTIEGKKWLPIEIISGCQSSSSQKRPQRQESPCRRHLGLDVLNLLQKPQQAQDLCPELPFRTRGHELEPATWNWQRGRRTTQLVSKQVQGMRILKVTSGGQHSLSHVEGDLEEATPSRNRNPPPPLSPRM
ncbi:regulator of chromosome condensation [Culex quinquefasciatus]|uniref:Regulator of chromosome condensation n=1 Tax=Culex quinquefasciatus TaxID=7176 RepID=B0WH53_CULQU|nr:regulator of chromosome condensation [Culex quinquefasciatus]|eukprot:XP_001848067.1 regulator of chromosome condensation [Culex quinquefasciatus]